MPVGEYLTEDRLFPDEQGSIIVVTVTDAPLLPNQLERIARRAGLGIGRTGTFAGDGSGDLCLALSTADGQNVARGASPGHLAHERLDALFEATGRDTEEAIMNALVAARSMKGRDGAVVNALDHSKMLDIIRNYRNLV